MTKEQFESVDEAIQVLGLQLVSSVPSEVSVASAFALGLLKDPERRPSFLMHYKKKIEKKGLEVPPALTYILEKEGKQEGGDYDKR